MGCGVSLSALCVSPLQERAVEHKRLIPGKKIGELLTAHGGFRPDNDKVRAGAFFGKTCPLLC